MKKTILAVSVSLLLTAPVFSKSEKRGVGENQFQYLAQMEALGPGVSWYYNWGNSEGNRVDGQEYMEFLPMCWSKDYNADNIRNYCKNHPECKYLLGFNEPNFKAQSNMTPSEAASAWVDVQALANELNLKLVAPVLNYSPDSPYNDPIKWMDEFVGLVGVDAFDYTAIHNYGGIGVMKDLATKFHDRYKKDVWVTEFCYWPNEGDKNSMVSPAKQIEEMMVAVEWLEKTEWIHKYAWFKAIGDSNSSKGPNYGLLISGKGEEPRELSEQGKVYLYMNDFDSQKYHSTGQPFAASEYISQSAAVMGSSIDPDELSPIEITKFSAGATLDYQIDVPTSEEYTLIMKVSGVGEPKRFDPTVGIYSVDGEGNETELCGSRTFSLSGDEEIYDNVSFPLNLKSGKQVIRIKDCNPYKPSGMHIYSLNLVSTAGVDEISAIDENKPVNVYNLQGVCVMNGVQGKEVLELLPKGFYIIGGKKVVVK